MDLLTFEKCVANADKKILSPSFGILKISGFHYEKFDIFMIDEYIVFKCYIKGGNSVTYAYLNFNALNCEITGSDNVSTKYNNITGKKESIFSLKSFKESCPFEIEENMKGEIWINSIKRMIYNKILYNLERIMANVFNFFKIIKYHGAIYLSDWSKIDNVKTLPYRLLLGLGSMYGKYGFKPVYEVDPVLVETMSTISKKVLNLEYLRALYQKRDSRRIAKFLDDLRQYHSNLFDILYRIEREYTYMFHMV